MNADLSFVQSDTHRRILAEILDQAQYDSEIIGVMLLGSVARGDANRWLAKTQRFSVNANLRIQ